MTEIYSKDMSEMHYERNEFKSHSYAIEIQVKNGTTDKH